MNDSVFHRLYDEYHQDVFQFLIYLVKNRHLSEDLMHEVYIRVFRAYDRFEGKSSEKTWLFSIAKNVAIDHFRKTAVRKKHSTDFFDWETQQLVSKERIPEEVAELNEDKILLYTMLDECTGDQKMVIIMRFFQDLSIAETADVLGWTEGKVKTTQHRAIKSLREKISAKEGGAMNAE
ncbi:RNA polymerase sigma-70 factor (ECF subfamily) [Planomicrobium koreense]|jgi:RNA polymerase sigma-70 factor (ECF subfamily)|uniref:RNA polymerase sigma-70 factor (ECF subfamily) n=1 Tax=Planococcus koreensis TaxID=112331 RepID=A0A7W8CNS6_9BACL|nr:MULTISPECIES: RNA polymerase sigma factor SigX [Planococcus]MBB5178711.1 RNA polymerase sigma-70 factor (ECF subfamily) [Planococcus koreensis]MDN3450415.1 RNA polymerase sigma factor SigX [Planococcus sp. APC 3906]